MGNYYEVLTDSSIKNSSKHPMELKKELAAIIVTRFHSQKAGANAREYFEKVFSKKETPDDMQKIVITKNDVKDGKIWIVNLLKKTSAVQSNGEARRLITQGAVSINDVKFTDPNSELVLQNNSILKIGAKRFYKITV